MPPTPLRSTACARRQGRQPRRRPPGCGARGGEPRRRAARPGLACAGCAADAAWPTAQAGLARAGTSGNATEPSVRCVPSHGGCVEGHQVRVVFGWGGCAGRNCRW
eukprot:363181-Chlamydomonas_euryale.AAC.4